LWLVGRTRPGSFLPCQSSPMRYRMPGATTPTFSPTVAVPARTSRDVTSLTSSSPTSSILEQAADAGGIAVLSVGKDQPRRVILRRIRDRLQEGEFQVHNNSWAEGRRGLRPRRQNTPRQLTRKIKPAP